MKADVLVIAGDGINCEDETRRAFERAGASVAVVRTNTLLESPGMILDYRILAFPGGFSYGDEIRSGKLLAEKLRAAATDPLKRFLASGGLMIGICNGFQILMQLGLFAEGDAREQTLKTNESGHFHNNWIELKIQPEARRSPWLKGVPDSLFLPMRHKEGRLAGTLPSSAQIAFRYTVDVNGALDRIAAVLDRSGQVLGIMPHPEAALEAFLHPSTIPNAPENANAAQLIFKNAVEHAQGKKNA